MVDEIYDRHYQEARSSMNGAVAAALSALAQTLRDSFLAQHRLEWSAPWASKNKQGQCN